MKKIFVMLSCYLVGIFLITSCSNGRDNTITIATTTSLVNTGLLDYLVEQYEEETDINIEYLSVGSGKAIEIGKADDADILILHSPKEVELQLVKDGYTRNRVPFIEDNFILASADDTFWDNTFVSRGDNSGTNARELEMWKDIPKPEKYIETGQGMLETLLITDEVHGTTIVDEGTWITNRDKTNNLASYKLNDKYAKNVYSVNTVITGDTQKEAMADDFSAWLTSEETIQKIINYKADEFEQSLYYRYEE